MKETVKQSALVFYLSSLSQHRAVEMVPGAGLEPARPFERGILNPLCLPISPPGQTLFKFVLLPTASNQITH